MSNNDDFEIITNKFGDEDFPGFDFSIPTEEELAEQKKKAAEELMHNGFLPKNEGYSETMSSPQEEVEKNPRRYIIEECVPACQELWRKNVYTYMVSDHSNKGCCWIEVIEDSLSDENKQIFSQLEGEGVIKFSYHDGCVNFGIKNVGLLGQEKLLELANQFQMQDVPYGQAYITVEEFLMNYCGCYDEVLNPEYVPMKTPWESDLPREKLYDYIREYERWENSIQGQETLRRFNPGKAVKPVEDLVLEHQMIIEDGRVYLSSFHHQKHKIYQNYLNNKRSIT